MEEKIKEEIRQYGTPEKAKILQRFFKTGKGEYGEGDIFLGVSMPQQGSIAKRFIFLSISEIESLLRSPEHEFRMVALLILVYQYEKGDTQKQQEIYDFYLSHTQWINNWDLVDVSAEHIVGTFLQEKDKSPLFHLAQSAFLWERRISIIATFSFLKKKKPKTTLAIAEILLSDSHDLIHKAVGWMLREIGKRCSTEEEKEFLDHYASKMPRTMLRYALEHFSEEERKKYLSKKEY